MMNVLDALRYRLTRPGAADLEGESLDLRGMPGPGRQLPPGLPLVVQDSILKRPSYREGDQYAPRDFGGEQNLPGDDPRNREYRLNDLLGFNEYMRRNSQQAWPEDSFATPLQPGQSPYATPEGPSPGMDTLPGGATRVSDTGGSVFDRGVEPQMSEFDRRLRAMGPNLPEYLPEQVWDSILNKPTYGEGQVIPGPRNPLMEQEAAAGAFRGPQRENELLYDRSQALGLLNPSVSEDQEPRSWALPEGDVWSSRPPGASPYASPLNQMMQLGRRAPLSMY